MTVRELADTKKYRVVNLGDGAERSIVKVFCCDLLSIAMGRAPAGCAWVTVMGNMNTMAVASLADAACVILAEGMELDGASVKKAEEQGITVFASEEPVFDTALEIYRMISGDGGL